MFKISRLHLAVIACGLSLSAMNAGAGLLDKVLGRPDPSEPLPPEQAFRIAVKAASPTAVLATLTPAPQHYLYRKSVRFALKDAKGAQLGALTIPRGTAKEDAFFGNTEVYTQPIRVTLPIERAAGPASFTVVVFYQGCNERLGVCYPPAEAEFPMQLP